MAEQGQVELRISQHLRMIGTLRTSFFTRVFAEPISLSLPLLLLDTLEQAMRIALQKEVEEHKRRGSATSASLSNTVADARCSSRPQSG